MRIKRQIVLNQKQAEETAKILLNLCQAAIIGLAGIPFATGFPIELRYILMVGLVVAAIILYFVAMLLLKKKRRK